MAVESSLILVTHLLKPLAVDYHDGFPAWHDEALFAPPGQDAADCEQSSARHLREFLTREENLDAFLLRFSDLFHESQESQGQPSGNFFGCHLAESLFEFVQAVGEDLADIPSDLRVLCHQDLKARVLPGERSAMLHRTRRTGVATGWDIGMDADGITLTIHPQNNFTTVWAELSELDATGLDEHEVADRLPLHE